MDKNESSIDIIGFTVAKIAQRRFDPVPKWNVIWKD